METSLICLAVALIGGLMLSRLTKKLNLPAVTAYLLAGLMLGPFCLGALKIPGLGFNSLHQVETLSVITQVALGFIAFTIGNEFLPRFAVKDGLSECPIPWREFCKSDCDCFCSFNRTDV